MSNDVNVHRTVNFYFCCFRFYTNEPKNRIFSCLLLLTERPKSCRIQIKSFLLRQCLKHNRTVFLFVSQLKSSVLQLHRAKLPNQTFFPHFHIQNTHEHTANRDRSTAMQKKPRGAEHANLKSAVTHRMENVTLGDVTSSL